MLYHPLPFLPFLGLVLRLSISGLHRLRLSCRLRRLEGSELPLVRTARSPMLLPLLVQSFPASCEQKNPSPPLRIKPWPGHIGIVPGVPSGLRVASPPWHPRMPCSAPAILRCQSLEPDGGVIRR